jgi:hypothetical protein
MAVGTPVALALHIHKQRKLIIELKEDMRNVHDHNMQ